MRDELLGLPQGWFHHGDQILALLERARPMVCVELGTWRGASAMAMARLIRQWGGVLYCVDTWMGEVNGGLAPGCPGMLLECAAHLVRAEVAASVRLIPALTVDAAQAWGGPALDFLYVDADHSRASTLADLTAWWPHLKPGALVAGDDYGNPLYPGVQEAWDAFEHTQGQRFARVLSVPDTDPPGMALVYGRKDRVRPSPADGMEEVGVWHDATKSATDLKTLRGAR